MQDIIIKGLWALPSGRDRAETGWGRGRTSGLS